MKINRKVLSIPPYISTSWKNINTLHVHEKDGQKILTVVLHNGATIEVPGLEASVILEVFTAHGKYIEQESEAQSKQTPIRKENNEPTAPSFSFGIPLGLNSENLENMSNMLQHNPQQADSPDLPPEVLKKISAIAQAVGMDQQMDTLPKAEPHCNCFYCQIARSFDDQNNDQVAQEEPFEEEVSEDDLKFRDWDIVQENDKLYIVTNPLNKNEHYQVYLGKPIGCTCGQQNCEHIRSVLNS